MPVDTDRRHHHPTYEASDFDVNDNSANNILLNMEYLKDKIVIADDATLSVNGESASSSSSSSSESDAYQWETHHDDNENDDDEDSFSNSSDDESYSSDEDQISLKKKSSMYASSSEKNKVSIYSSKCPVPKNKTANRDSSYKTSLRKERSKSLYSNTTATSRTTATSNSSDLLTGRFVGDDSEGSLEREYRDREDMDSVSEQHQHRFHRQASTTIPEELDEDNDDGDASDKAKFTPITPVGSDEDDDPPPPPPSDDDDGISDISDEESSLLMVRYDGRSDGEGDPKKKKTNISKVIKAVSSKVSPRSRSRKKGIKNISPRNSPRSRSPRRNKNGRPNSPMGDTLMKALNVFAAADSQIASWKSPKINSKKSNSNSNSEMLDDSDDLLARTDDILGDLYQKKKQYLPSESSSDSEAEEEKQHDEFLDRIANAHANALGKAERIKSKSSKRLAKRSKKKKKSQQRGSNSSIYSDQGSRKAINSIDGDDSSPRRPRRRSIKVAISRPLKMLKNMSKSQRNLMHGSQRSLQSDIVDNAKKRCSQTSVVTIQTDNSNSIINNSNKNYDTTQRGSFAAALSRASSSGIDDSRTKEEELEIERQKSVDAQIFDAITTAVSDLKVTSNSPKTAFHASRKQEGNDQESNSRSGVWQSVLRAPKTRSTDIHKVSAPSPTANQRQESGVVGGFGGGTHIRQSIGYHTAEDEVDLDDTKNRIKEAASRFKTRQQTMRNQQLKRELRISQEEEQKLEMEIKEYERRIDILEEGHKSITAAAMSAPLHDLFVLQETTLIQLDAVDDTRNTLKIQARLYRSQLASNNEYMESLRDERVDEASKSDQLELLFTKCGLAPAGFDDLMSSQIKLQLECQELNQKLDALGGYYDYPEEKQNVNNYNNHDDADAIAMPTFNRGVSLQSGFSGGSSQDIQQMMMNIAGKNNENDSSYLFPGDAANNGKNSIPRRRSKTVAYLP